MENTNKTPYNLEAEQSLLGCILVDQTVQSEILSSVDIEDFLVEKHKTIIVGMISIYSNNIPVDFVTLTDMLQKKGTLEKAGGISYISNLTQTVPSAANYKQYYSIVKRDSVLRKLIEGANKIIRMAQTSTDSTKAIEFAQSVVFDISEGEHKSGLERIGKYTSAVIDKFEKLEKDKNYFDGLKTGFPKLDYFTNGLHEGNLIILAARPSDGKTTLAMNIVENIAAKKSASVAVFALEMTKLELAQRMMCSLSETDMGAALKGKLTETEGNSITELFKAKAILDRANIYVDETPVLTPQDILAKCRKHKINYGLDLVVIDHIQLMSTVDKMENRQQQVSGISRAFKTMAKELNVPVLALSQLSRQVTTRKGKPVLSDLRESGAIEQDADMVLFIYRQDRSAIAEEAEKAVPNVADIIVAKNRNGACGDFKLLFKGQNVKFVNLADDNLPGEPKPKSITSDIDSSFPKEAPSEDEDPLL